MTSHPGSQPTAPLVTVLGGARWGRLVQMGGGWVSLQVFDWGVQIGLPVNSVFARLAPPTRLEWAEIDSMELRRRSSRLRFERSHGAPITFHGETSLEPAVNVLRSRGLIEN